MWYGDYKGTAFLCCQPRGVIGFGRNVRKAWEGTREMLAIEKDPMVEV